jgi:hypothetical protein
VAMAATSTFNRRLGELTASVLLAAFLGALLAVKDVRPWWTLALLVSTAGLCVALHLLLPRVGKRSSLVLRAASLALLPAGMTVSGALLLSKVPDFGDAMMLSGAAVLLWFAAIATVRAAAAPDPDLVAGRISSATQSARARHDGILLLTLCLSIPILVLAGWNLRSELGSLQEIGTWLLSGAGIYVVLLVGAALLSLAGAYNMLRRGSVALPAGSTNAQRDRLWMLRFGGRALSAFGLGLMLVAFWYSQPDAAQPAEPAKHIGFFDLMTWLGTFATLVVVVATALVAMYVKRRDDESQHSAAITDMRQRWIDNLRQNLAAAMAGGHSLRSAARLRKADPGLAGNVRKVLREIELQLNPTEGHHAVLLWALRSWLHEAGIEDHFRGDPMPAPKSVPTDFDILARWLVMLGQLVLKVEWAVTSQGRESIEMKAGRLWNDLVRFEKAHAPELTRLASEAMAHRAGDASSLLQGANALPAGTA